MHVLCKLHRLFRFVLQCFYKLSSLPRHICTHFHMTFNLSRWFLCLLPFYSFYFYCWRLLVLELMVELGRAKNCVKSEHERGKIAIKMNKMWNYVKSAAQLQGEISQAHRYRSSSYSTYDVYIHCEIVKITFNGVILRLSIAIICLCHVCRSGLFYGPRECSLFSIKVTSSLVNQHKNLMHVYGHHSRSQIRFYFENSSTTNK